MIAKEFMQTFLGSEERFRLQGMFANATCDLPRPWEFNPRTISTALCVVQSQTMSASRYVRNLIFQSYNLGKVSDLVLTFEDVVWKVDTFGAKGSYETTATYRNQLAVTKPEVISGRVVGAGPFVDIDVGQHTTLIKAGDVLHFSDPVVGRAGVLMITNHAGTDEDVGIGFQSAEASFPTTMKYFPKLGNNSTIVTTATPRLRGYVASGYQEGEILTGDIPSTPLFVENLAELPETTIWNLTWDPDTEEYAITRVRNEGTLESAESLDHSVLSR
ncbi:uncharacterized protein BJ212DRAFT_1420195 [Suillus subaureus]|uniref:Uncharacterized protein n=1 Tax=Suillus subaureus TaxID=48587 RepID=A0A9P7ALC8_9AGAM|nr:uncharacterized protein BJ212DRAFT_1420195 [Suillus subaureus]KAG1790745.1 hypothetical protein BJ212DRAFT_1420195 [Suillus subaureus]